MMRTQEENKKNKERAKREWGENRERMRKTKIK